jgi:hypothetical protein
MCVRKHNDFWSDNKTISPAATPPQGERFA